MADNTERMLGEIKGSLDRLTDNFDKYLDYHDQRHEKLDSSLHALEADINQAKGAKSAVMIAGAAVSGLVAIVAAAADRFIK